jgi:hypothetical protein
MIEAIKKYRILGTPKRKISILLIANKAPAMPAPPGILETLICGFGALSLMLHLLSLDYHCWEATVNRTTGDSGPAKQKATAPHLRTDSAAKLQGQRNAGRYYRLA